MLVCLFAEPPRVPIQGLSVRRLGVSFYSHDPSWMEKIDQLLSLLPNVKQLSIRACSIFVDFPELSAVLKRRLPHLDTLKCAFHVIAILPGIEDIERLHPLFRNYRSELIGDRDRRCKCTGMKLCLSGKK